MKSQTTMYRPSKAGLANKLMQICQVNLVSSNIYDGGYGKYMKLTIPVQQDDGTLPSLDPPLTINPGLHYNISEIMKPTEEAKTKIEEYRHLVDGVSFGLQIRRGCMSECPDVSKWSAVHCDDTALAKFHQIMEQNSGTVYLSSDCIKVKRDFAERYPGRVRYLDEEAAHSWSGMGIEDPWVTFTEFYLLSMCPVIFMTGGARDMFTFSTFGYMAAMYGRKQYLPVFNDCEKSLSREDYLEASNQKRV